MEVAAQFLRRCSFRMEPHCNLAPIRSVTPPQQHLAIGAKTIKVSPQPPELGPNGLAKELGGLLLCSKQPQPKALAAIGGKGQHLRFCLQLDQWEIGGDLHLKPEATISAEILGHIGTSPIDPGLGDQMGTSQQPHLDEGYQGMEHPAGKQRWTDQFQPPLQIRIGSVGASAAVP
jgi:hypothetical protein